MSGNFVLLEEAAQLLGITPDALVEMRSRGEIRGFREGSSWKFKMEDIQQVIRNREDAGNSDIGSDISLVADPGSGSDVKLVAGRSGVNVGDSGVGSDITLDSSIKIDSDGSDLPLDSAGASDLELSLSEGSDVLEASGLKLQQPSANKISSDSDADIGSDLELADDDDLVLGGGGSDLALAKDSGLNLMSPSDSGISLEDAPLDLAANSGISGLDLVTDVAPKKGPSASGSGSLVDFQQDEEFQLSPSSGDMEIEEDSGSQVIELEDSSDFGDTGAVALPGDMGMDMGAASGGFGGFGDGGNITPVGSPAAPIAMVSPEVPIGIWQVLTLLTTLLLMCMSGILVTDIVRNMWSWNGSSDMTSGFTSMVLSAFGMN
jgi:excisionase family DNA binding protein